MAWIEKSTPTSFDSLPIHGLCFLYGDVLARALTEKYGAVETPFFNANWLKDQKLPQVEFPSRVSFDIWEVSTPERGGIIHLFGEMDLPYFDTRDSAWDEANSIAEQVGYFASMRGENQLVVVGHDDDEQFIITYDNVERRMANVERLPKTDERPVQPAHVLITDEIRANLPPLYTNEQIGFEAKALVKYFTADAHWTWYASEASALFDDGTYKPLSETDLSDLHLQDVIFFGLVVGDEIEFGYFSAVELHSVRGALGLYVERDLSYEPQTLHELEQQHRRERSET